jgi:hypothetical protein
MRALSYTLRVRFGRAAARNGPGVIKSLFLAIPCIAFSQLRGATLDFVLVFGRGERGLFEDFIPMSRVTLGG